MQLGINGITNFFNKNVKRDYKSIIAGFVLTTLLGGGFGTYIQNRSWEKQNQLEILEADRVQAEKIFSEISIMMDTRLYEMRKLLQARNSNVNVSGALDSYRQQLDFWNSRLNRNLSMIQFYFGKDNRAYFEEKIHFRFRDIGALLEKDKTSKRHSGQIQRDLDSLNNDICRFDLHLLYSIKRSRVGRGLEYTDAEYGESIE